MGIGGIGTEVIKRAKSFGMNVVAWSRNLSADQADQLGITRCENLQELAAVSDVVSIHVSSTSETEKLIDEQFLSSMKDNAIFINTSRGKVVDETALADAARSKKLKIGLDVYEQEPSSGENTFTSNIADIDGVYGTHHVGASTSQAQEAIANEAVRIIAMYLSEGRVLNCVNQASDATAPALLSVRHKNLPGVLAHIFDQLSLAGVNVEEMENIMYEGGYAACARIQLNRIPTQDQLDTIKNNEHILSVTLATQI